MITSDFMVYWRVSSEYIPQSKEVHTLFGAKGLREELREQGYQVKIEVRGNDY